MAQFRATIAGQRGEASRLGSKKSGITADVAGWMGGVRVVALHKENKYGEMVDRFEVYATTGSDHSVAHTDGPAYLGFVDSKGNFYASSAIASRATENSPPQVSARKGGR